MLAQRVSVVMVVVTHQYVDVQAYLGMETAAIALIPPPPQVDFHVCVTFQRRSGRS